jgi:hypothetical protein
MSHEFGLTHFMVTMKFVGPQGIATRVGYHVPRLGDHVSFPADDHEEGKPYMIVIGTVNSVLWLDDYIHINVTMGKDLDAQMLHERGLN